MEIMENKLAIIIPYYKHKYFGKTLESLSAQTDKRFSVYIGDDGSPESPEDILSDFKDKLPFSYVHFQENIGGKNLVDHWERCIKLSKNEDWIMILGDDDTLSENYVEAFYQHLSKVEKKSIQVIRFASRHIDENDVPTSAIYTNPETELAAESYMRIFKGNGRSTLTEHIFTRKTFEKHHFRNFPVAFGSDVVAWLEFPEMGVIYSINDAFANIRISADHLSSKPDPVLRYKRHEGIYLFNRYIIQNYASYFSKEDQYLILKKAYKNLRSATRSKKEALSYILFMLNKAGLKHTWEIIQSNRYS